MRWVLIFLSFALCNCIGSPKIEMSVKSYSDPAQVDKLVYLRTFTILPTNTYDPLQEKEILYILKNNLVSKGYVHVVKNPDFIASIDFSIDPVQVSGTKLSPVITMGQGISHFVPVPYVGTELRRAIVVLFNAPDGTPLWQGEAENLGDNSDLLSVAPTLIAEILKEFPYRTGKKSERRVRLKE